MLVSTPTGMTETDLSQTGLSQRGSQEGQAMRKYYSLYGRLLDKQRLYEAFKYVKCAQSAVIHQAL